MLLAFSGKIGIGKSSVSKEVATALGWPWVGFGDYVRQVAATRDIEPIRLNLQNLGEQLLQTDKRNFCAAVLAQAPVDSINIVVDGVRHQEVLQQLRELQPLERLIHVHLVADEPIRVSRLAQRQGETDFIELSRADHHSTEQQVVNEFLKDANLIIDASQPIAAQVEKILAIL